MTIMVGPRWSRMVIGVDGKIAPLTLLPSLDHVQAWFQDECVATCDRTALCVWLRRHGYRRPLEDFPMHFSWNDFGVWLEIYTHVAPTLIEEEQVRRLLQVCSS